MKVNIKTVLCATVFILFIGYNVYSSQKKGVISEMALANIEALASGEELGCGGNPTFIKDNTLKSTPMSTSMVRRNSPEMQIRN